MCRKTVKRSLLLNNSQVRKVSEINTPIPTVAVVVFNDFSPFHVSVPSIVFGKDTLGETLFNLELVAGEEGFSLEFEDVV